MDIYIFDIRGPGPFLASAHIIIRKMSRPLLKTFKPHLSLTTISYVKPLFGFFLAVFGSKLPQYTRINIEICSANTFDRFFIEFELWQMPNKIF